MDLDKLIYDVIESVNAVSDDRHVDERLVKHRINSLRADLYRKMLAKRPGHDTTGISQDISLELEVYTRSLDIQTPLDCFVLRSINKVPELLYEGTLSNSFTIRSIDVLRNTIEVITKERAVNIVFEFNCVYAFLETNGHVYFLCPNSNMDFRHALLTGVFEDPLEADPSIEDYPIKLSDWNTIKPYIVNDFLNTPADDPRNNSEEDRAQVNSRRGSKTSENTPSDQ